MNKSTQRIQRQGNNFSNAATTTIKRIRKRGNGSESRRYEQVEKALRESEEKFRNLFEYAKDAIILADTETGTILDVNTAGCNLLGLPKEKIIGKHQSEIYPPELAEKYKQLFQDHVQKGVVIAEDIIVQRADGVQIPMDISASVIKLADKTIVQGIFRDVTERVRMAKALQESEEKFSKAFRAIPEAVSVATLKGGVFLEVNDSFLYLNGYTREEVIGHTAKELNIWVNPDDRYRIKQLMEKNGRFENEEFILQRKSGETRTVLMSADSINFGGQPCILTIGADITERKNIEEALKERERRFSDIAENALEWIWEADANGKYTYSSPVVEKILGYKPEEMLEKHFYDLFSSENREEMRKAAFEAFARKQPFREFINQNAHKNGKTVWLSTSGTPIIDEKGNLLGYRGADTDITARKRAEKVLTESEEKFRNLFENARDMIVLVNTETGIILDINTAGCNLLGLPKEKIIGRHQSELHPPELADKHKQLFQDHIQRGGHINDYVVVQRADGAQIPIDISASVIKLADKTIMQGIFRDVTERVRMEKALRESEEKFSKAFHALPEQVTIVRVKDNVFIDVNESFCRNNGYTREEVIGRKREELNLLIGPSQREQFTKIVKEQGHAENTELECRDKSGKTRTLLFSADIINIGGEPCLLTIANDISQRKQMERAIGESEEKFSKAFHASPEAIAIVTAKDEKYIDINESYTQITGYSREELIGKTASSMHIWPTPEDHTKMRKMLQEQGRIYNEEFDYRTKSGETRTRLLSLEPLTINGEPCTIGVSKDITERKKMEQALKESEEKFSKAFHAMPEEVTIARLKDNVFVDVNESFCRNNGCTREEVIGRKGEELNLLIGPSQRDQAVKMVKERGHAENIELEFRDESGEVHTLLFSADTINLGGEPCLLTIGNDISQRKQAERKLEEALADLEQSSALLKATNKELESFSYSVSHDLRSPLRSIAGFSQALLEDYSAKLDEKGQDYLNRLCNASQKMGELIDGLLKLSRLTRSEMHYEKVNLTSLANEIVTRLQETHDKRDVKFIIGSDLTANGDPQMLRVLLENLLGNAWKFTKNTKQARIEFGSITESERKTFFIKDNGAGFDMAYKDKLFGAFQRLHDSAEFPGTGIGLATVQRIINRHGGSIRAEGAVGKGATFYFSLN